MTGKATHKTSLLAAAQRCLFPGVASEINLKIDIQRRSAFFQSRISCFGTRRFSSSTTSSTNVVDNNHLRTPAVRLQNLKQQTRSGNKHRQKALAQKTQWWLKKPVGSWSRKDVALGRSLLEDWLRLPSATPDRAPWTHWILSRWMEEKYTNANLNLAGHEMLDMLHRVLYAWRMKVLEGVVDDRSPNHNALEESRSILHRLEQLYQTTNDKHLRPGDKAYSMVLQILALSSPKHNPKACEEAMGLLKLCSERRCKTNAPDIVVWNSCLHVLAKHSLYQSDAPEQAEALLEQMMGAREPLIELESTSLSTTITPPLPDTTSFALVLEAWCNSRRPGGATRAHAILDRMIQQHGNDAKVPAPNTTCFNICIDGHAKSPDSGSAQQAQDLLEYMLASNTRAALPLLQPDHISFLSTMKAWTETCDKEPNGASKVEALLQQMQSLYDETGDPSFRPTASCYAVVLDALSRTPNAGPKVEKLLQQLQEREHMNVQAPKLEEQHSDQPHLHPSQGSPIRAGYLAAIRAWGNTTNVPDAPERAEALLQKVMEEEGLGDACGNGNLNIALAPYSAVIGAWSKSPRPEAPQRALALLRHMQHNAVNKHGPSPNTVIYNSVLNAFAKKGDAVSAIALLEEMKAQYNNGNLDVQPDVFSYSTTINGLARTRDLPDAAERATELLEELFEQYAQTGDNKLRPTTHTYSSAILAWSNSYRMDCGEQAEQIFWKMVELSEDNSYLGVAGPKPITIVCNCVLRAWARSTEGGAAERAEAILEWMESQYTSGANSGVSPDRNTFQYILQTWAKSRRVSSIRRIEEHLHRMIRESKNNIAHPLFPDASCYNCLLEAWQSSRDNNKAQKCLSILEQLLQSSAAKSNKLWNLQSFHIVLMACLHSPNLGQKESNLLDIQKILQTTFKHLTVADEAISDRTIELILRVHAKTGEPNDAFLLNVFQVCHSQRNSVVNTKRILRALQASVSEQMYEALERNETKARSNARIAYS